MSRHLSDASRFFRGLTHLSRQVINEATKSTDYPRRLPSSLETLGSILSSGINGLSNVRFSNAASKTAWKSSVLIRQTGIALSNAIRSSPPNTTVTPRTTIVDDRITLPFPSDLSQSLSHTTTVAPDPIPIPTYPELNTTTVQPNTTMIAQDKLPIPSHPKLDSPLSQTPISPPPLTTMKPIVQDKIPIPSYPKLDPVTNSITPPVIESKPSPTVMKPKVEPTTSIPPASIVTPSTEPSFFTPSVVESETEKTSLKLNDTEPIASPPTPTNADAQARAVPTTRIGRLASFGSLAAGLGVGALGSLVRRSVGLESEKSSQAVLSPYLSKANAERIVDTLCKVRGAALKLGQMISIQDNFLVQDDIQKIFERVRQKADFMPEWQMNEVMTNEFGSEWRNHFVEFQDRPFAAASIGQVHYGVLKDKQQRVAVKIQYPGVGKSIESDINNLVTLLNFWNIIPKGLYIDSVIKVAKRELNWEVDYIREAEWGRRFQNWLKGYPIYSIPDVIDDLSTKNVITTTFFDGITLDNAVNEDQPTRDRLGEAILELCLLELFKFKAMQTDPNWSNFLFNPKTKVIGLIDFGSSRDFNPNFIDNYIQIIRASADNDPKRIEKLSIEGGFLTGYETREMTDAHVKAVMILGEGFHTPGAFDFGQQSTTHNIHKLIPVMLKHRLTPPPEDTYSLHRKMAGAFLLCSKLRSRVHCRPLFDRIWNEYQASVKR